MPRRLRTAGELCIALVETLPECLCVLAAAAFSAPPPALRCGPGAAHAAAQPLAFELLVRLMQFAFSGSGLLLCARTRCQRGAQASASSLAAASAVRASSSEMTTIRMRGVVSRADRVISGLCGWSFGCVGRLIADATARGRSAWNGTASVSSSGELKLFGL